MSDFDVENKDEIQKRMVTEYAKTGAESTTMEGSFVRDIISANSVEFENTRAIIDLAIQAVFANTSWGQYLTERAWEYGIDRTQAVKAKGKVIFTGSPGAQIPEGTLVAAVNGFEFETVRAVTVNEEGTCTADVIAVEPGTAGNFDTGKICVLPLSVPGVYSVINEKPTEGGANEETDTALLSRYEYALRNPQTSGNRYHYYSWAMSVAGVGTAKVIPLWNGPGTVKVIILDEEGHTASTDLTNRVIEYIEEKRPIGADVTVVSPEPLKVTISIKNLVGNLDEAKLIQDVQNYCTSQGLNLTSLSNVQVGQFVLQQKAVKDFDYIKLNNAKRITPEGDKIIVIEKVNLT